MSVLAAILGSVLPHILSGIKEKKKKKEKHIESWDLSKIVDTETGEMKLGKEKMTDLLEKQSRTVGTEPSPAIKLQTLVETAKEKQTARKGEKVTFEGIPTEAVKSIEKSKGELGEAKVLAKDKGVPPKERRERRKEVGTKRKSVYKAKSELQKQMRTAAGEVKKYKTRIQEERGKRVAIIEDVRSREAAAKKKPAKEYKLTDSYVKEQIGYIRDSTGGLQKMIKGGYYKTKNPEIKSGEPGYEISIDEAFDLYNKDRRKNMSPSSAWAKLLRSWTLVR